MSITVIREKNYQCIHLSQTDYVAMPFRLGGKCDKSFLKFVGRRGRNRQNKYMGRCFDVLANFKKISEMTLWWHSACFAETILDTEKLCKQYSSAICI